MLVPCGQLPPYASAFYASPSSRGGGWKPKSWYCGISSMSCSSAHHADCICVGPTVPCSFGSIDRSASHHHIPRRLGAATGNGAARHVVGERAHATRDGDHHPSLTAGNEITKGLDHPQGPHRVHMEYMGASLLPRRAGNPVAVDEQVYRDILELRCGVPAAFGVGHVIATTLSMPLCLAPSTGARHHPA